MPSKRSAAPRSPSTSPTFPSDWHEFLSLLTSHHVKFVVVGARAFAIDSGASMSSRSLGRPAARLFLMSRRLEMKGTRPAEEALTRPWAVSVGRAGAAPRGRTERP